MKHLRSELFTVVKILILIYGYHTMLSRERRNPQQEVLRRINRLRSL
jgi:hypothetical protein